MNRRRLLRALAAGATVGLAGCSASRSAPREGRRGDGVTVEGDDSPSVVRGPRGRVELPVDEAEIDDVVPQDRIPAITEPAFGADWSDTDYELGPDQRVVGVVRDGEARAYPLAVLDWHEVVNDDLGGPLLVTFCPLCGSGVTAERRVGGAETVFGVSGMLWRSDLVMYDRRTESLWSQILGTAIRGERTGDRLELVPSTITTWGQWRADHAGTRVLLPPPASETIVTASPRNYGIDPYAGYEDSENVGVGGDFEDDRLHPKARVVGVATETEAVAYPYERVVEAGVINDRVGDLPVVVAAGAGETLSAFERRVDGETLTFEPDGEGRMRAGGSSWTRSTGIARDGPFRGTKLDDAARVTTEFWFAWLNFHPDTTVYGRR